MTKRQAPWSTAHGQDTVVDPNERAVMPRNSSKSFKDGGGTMRHAERSLQEHYMDVEGGGRFKGHAERPADERSLPEHLSDVSHGGKSSR